LIKIDLPAQFTHAAVQIFLKHPSATESELVGKISAGVGSSDLAERLVEFVPLAFGRIILVRAGVQLPGRFVRMLDDGTFTPECPLEAEPVWKPAMDFARRAETRLSKDEFLAIAARSAEFDAVNKACQAGSNPKDLVGAVPIFMRAAPMPPLPPKPWWQFWK
jgi:hypothetical protein